MRKLFVIAILVASTSHAVADAECPQSTEAVAVTPVALARVYADALAASHTEHGTFSHFDTLFEFELGRVRVYSKDREKLQALAKAWKAEAKSDLITIEAFAGSAERDGAALAQKRAARARDYLVKFGVAADRVVAKASVRAETKGPRLKGSIDLTIGTPACSSSGASIATAP